MLKNEAFALACLERYAEEGLVVDSTNGEFAHCPYPKGMGETGYYLLWEHHQQQGLYQSEDFDRVCFFKGDVKRWLQTCTYWPDDFFGLWDIYDKWSKASVYLNPDTGERRLLTSDQANENSWVGLNRGKGVYLDPDSGKYALINKEEAQVRGLAGVNSGMAPYRDPETGICHQMTRDEAQARGWVGNATGRSLFKDPELGVIQTMTKEEAAMRGCLPLPPYRNPETGECRRMTSEEAQALGWVGLTKGRARYRDPETGECQMMTKEEAEMRGWVGVSSGTRYKHPPRTCPHCGLTGGGAQMTRYHFDNCKRRE